MTIIVQFSDSEKTKIISWFGSMPPFPEQFKNLGDVKADDPKWKDYYDLMSQFTPGMPEPIDPAMTITEVPI
ncbi:MULTISPECIES: hypothetical protein [Yersinia]|uniref:hypothetical protein n=1 Tax=Yersinia TaxID=629 RepID=UPI0005E62C4A|nr:MULTISPECIES: hypothetical protein [Yersinia]MDA5498017.1 hypothetical protein [Yersinia aleksiciae]NIL00982.1 hypothetical protein [Yersinia aleksiciae]WQC71634.1 hypothetical protein N0K21_03975 [Yersinia aleksiciae]CNE76380.1 Uncharacterised protein [Yersinia mollaretii]